MLSLSEGCRLICKRTMVGLGQKRFLYIFLDYLFSKLCPFRAFKTMGLTGTEDAWVFVSLFILSS